MPKAIFSRFELGEPGQEAGNFQIGDFCPYEAIFMQNYAKISKSAGARGTDPGQFSPQASNSCNL